MTYFKKMFSFMRPYIVLYCIGIFLSNSQSFVFGFVIGLIGSNVMAGAVAGSARVVVTGTVSAMGAFIGLLSLVGLGRYLYHRARFFAQKDLKQRLFRSFMQRGLESSQSRHSGEGIAAINTDADEASNLYSYAISQFLSPVITGVLSSVTLFIIDWRMGLAAIGLGVFAYFAQSRFVKPLAKIGKERLEANASAVKEMSNIFQGAIPIRAFNMQEKALDSASAQMNVLKILDFRQAFIAMWQRLFSTIKGWLALVFTFGFGGWLVATGQLDFPVLLLILPLFERISSEMGDIGQALAEMQPPLEAAKRIFAIIDNAPASEDKGHLDFDGSALHIRGLNFKYQNAEHNTLHDISLDINVGEMVAFVGASGSGKSTILRILVGFYEREQLGLTLGGTSSDAVSIVAWRENFAYVDQSCKLFDMTIKENIAMGRPRRSGWRDNAGPPCTGKKDKVEDADIIAAAKQAFAHDFIEQLDQKYDSPCGEKGGTLSGGQKQRIAIARALIKGSPILVFDEATSALDSDSEKYIMDTIQSLRNNHTILITTHNLTTITKVDKIVVMDKGRIAEIGKHDELMAKKGIYHKLFINDSKDTINDSRGIKG